MRGIRFKSAFIATCSGSSPRVRGIPLGTFTCHQVNRFIPAGAGNTLCSVRPEILVPVHPRGCGEYWVVFAIKARIIGSSPRVRGILIIRIPNSGEIRFIPAGAGNTLYPNLLLSPNSVHPRGCGEYVICLPVEAPASRFIPAGAGNTSSVNRLALIGAVHPRGCGEYVFRPTQNYAGVGSSPRVRGILNKAMVGCTQNRFIPAGAGNTNWVGAMPPLPPGSSPRVRGIPLNVPQTSLWLRFIPAGAGNTVLEAGLDLFWRFIPAGAGNTLDCRWWANGRPVHPRGCGEYASSMVTVCRLHGSSPRVRGIRAGMGFLSARLRFIPAGAGNTVGVFQVSSLGRFIPAGAGNTSPGVKIDSPGGGSSPRVRGIPPRRFAQAVYDGSSPRVRGILDGYWCGSLAHGSSPRVRGIPPLVSQQNLLPGSSPRVRGILGNPINEQTAVRFIPAGAGNTVPRDCHVPL